MAPGKEYPRQKSLFLPEVRNPFVHEIKLTTAEKIQIALMTVTVFPLRLLGLCIFLIMAWVLAGLTLMGRKPEDTKEPMSGWRNCLRFLVVLFCRAVFFVGGFHWISTKGKLASPTQATILATAPHSTYFDALAVVFFQLTTVVAKSSVENVPIFNILTRFTQPVLVSREDPNSRINTIKEIQRRAQSGGKWPQIVIFPEGTCTNRSCLISFKPGGFYPGVAVQPVLLRYNNKLDTFTWTWEGPGAFKLLWYTLCQFNNSLEIEYLPVYTPSEEEKKDARLYADNVRAVMAKALEVPMTDHTYEDTRLMNYAAKLAMPAAAGLVEFAKLSRKLGMKFDNMAELLEKFCGMAQDDGGEITLEQFAKYLELPVSEPLKEVFQLYDRDGSGKLDFREYVIGLSLIAMPSNSEETIQLAFQAFDKGGKGYILQEELHAILETALGMTDVDVLNLFKDIDEDKDGKITYSN